jgi:hypothetical protein
MNHEIFYLVWREGGGSPTYKHPTHPSANQEAERLARLNPGAKFHVLVCLGTVRTNDVLWTETDLIPF